jgi:iron(III) transport system permease protein
MDVLSFAPTAIPPIVMAMAILLLYLRTPIYGTLAVLIVGNLTIYLAFGTRTMSTAILQLHTELGDAALVSGASWWTMFRKIVVPLVWGQFVNGWLWILSHSARDLTIPLVLMSSANLVMATAIWMTWDYPDLAGASALSILLVGGLLLLVLPMQLLTLRWGDQRN